jgi:hemoglobin/transferrin/lactoferrin receptor protein
MHSFIVKAPLIHKLRASLLIGVSLPIIALTTSVFAKDSTANLQRSNVTILKPIVVYSTRSETQVLDVPQLISVINRAELDDRNVRDIQDLVRHQAGVTVQRTTSSTNPWGQLTGFTIRGMGGNRVQMSVDGARIQEQITDGSRDFFDMGNMKAVEIVKGPNSVLWGADALGGSVMFSTRDPEDLLTGDKRWALEVKTGYDSFDQSWKKAVTGAYETGDWQFLASYNNSTSKEGRLRNARADGGIWGCTRQYIGCDRLFPADTDTHNVLGKVVWSPDSNHTVKLTGEYFDRNTSVTQMYDMSAAAAGIPSTTAYINEPYIRDLDMQRFRFAVEHNWDLESVWIDNINWRFSHSPQKRQTESKQHRVYSNRYELRDQFRDYSETFTELDVQLKSEFDLGETRHKLTYGFDGDITKGDYTGINTTYNSLTQLTTVAVNQGFSFPRVDTTRADFYIQDEIEFFDGALTLTPGMRFAHYSIDPTGDGSYPGLPGYKPQKQTSNEVIKRVGAIYKLDEQYSVYANYGEGFKMPTSAQLFQSSNDPFSGSSVVPNPNLQPESVKNYEIGLRGQFDRGYFSIGAFYSDYHNFIRGLQQTTIINSSGNPVTAYTSNNVEDVRFWGLEFGAEYEVLDYTTLSANVAWSKGRQKTSATAASTAFDNAVPFTAILGVSHELPEYNLKLDLLATLAAGKKEASSDKSYLPSGYGLLDAYAKWAPKENIEVTFGVENIFDRRYFPNSLTGYDATPASAAVANVNPIELQTGPGRVFKLGATVKF